ncbi:torsin-1A-like [Bufo gargarizans]|uniref:torsin-1A-like n=1 Tax=Bufo gargarizans TaxID=30331 RepID=UPI001CF0FE6B|nr:torsin-1A-like [Bufo gargarizans]
MKWLGVALWLLLPVISRGEPITITVGTVSVITGIISYYGLHNYLWGSSRMEGAVNVTALQVDFDQNIFGQHLAKHVILKAVPRFLSNENPKKPLALSLHGWTGTGKNYISQILVHNIYSEPMRKKCVRTIVATLHFPHANRIQEYKDQLQTMVKSAVKDCERSIFIFDEIDKMHPGLIDAIKPFLDYYDHIDGVSYRKAIFIFLSNAGGEKITELALKFWRAGRPREEIKLSDVERDVYLSAFNKKDSGYWHSSLIDKNLIDVFVPFFPMEFKHIKMCVKTELERRGFVADEEITTTIAKDMTYYPPEEKVYSVKGCKTVSTKLDLFL